jgi:hypothetical protein
LEKKNNPSNNPPLVKGAKNRLDTTTWENIVIENKKRPTDLKMEERFWRSKKNRQEAAFIEQSMLMMPQRYTRRS